MQADQLFDMTTSEFRCTFCGSLVEEDISALPKKDSRLLLAKFNEQLQPLYDLLREVEEIKLAPECLEPEPVDIDTIRGLNKQQTRDGINSNEQWSGEATRNQGFAVEETRVDVTIGDENQTDVVKIKDRPIWMTESTVISTTEHTNDITESILQKAAQSSTQVNITTTTSTTSARGKKENEDIMSVLLQHEKQATKNNNISSAFGGLGGGHHSSESSDDERENHKSDMRKFFLFY